MTRRPLPPALALAVLATALPPLRAATPKGDWQHERRGDAAGDNLGFSLAPAGDFDGDGWADIVAGVIFDDTLAPAAGKAIVLFGGPEGSARREVALFGDAAADDHFGVSVAGGGDLDGDGHDDIAVGARLNDRGIADGGAVFVFFGGPGADGVADVVIPGTRRDDWFGQSVAIVEDIDGDGDDELLIGAPYNDDRGSAAGRATLHRGGPGLGGAPAFAVHGDTQDDGHFGWSVANAGDTDGDGHGDWIVGARMYGVGPQRALGRAYLYRGGPGADGVPDCVRTGERRDDWFGERVAGVGDVDGDGYDDVAVGAIFWDRLVGIPASAVGRAYVFPGGPDCETAPIAVADGYAADDQMGFSLGGPVVDPLGPGALWLAGARFADAGPVLNAGEVRLLRGTRGGQAAPLLVSRGDDADDQWGYAVAAASGVLGEPGRAYAAAGVFDDAGGDGAGQVTVAARDCLRLHFPEAGGTGVLVTGCAEYGAVALFAGTRAGGLAGLACLEAGPGPDFSSGPNPSASGEVRLLLAVGEDADGRRAAAGYDSLGVARRLEGPCP